MKWSDGQEESFPLYVTKSGACVHIFAQCRGLHHADRAGLTEKKLCKHCQKDWMNKEKARIAEEEPKKKTEKTL